MNNQTVVVVAVLGALVLSLLALGWHENERRYDGLRMTGCFGDSASSPLGVTQECTGARRVCRDSPPLIDWRHFCD
jgi:hypothetical protein